MQIKKPICILLYILPCQWRGIDRKAKSPEAGLRQNQKRPDHLLIEAFFLAHPSGGKPKPSA